MRKKNKKRKIKKSVKFIAILIFIIIIAFSGYKVYMHTKTKKPTKKPEIKTPEVVKPKEINEHYELTLIGVGDMLVHSSVYNDANKHANWNGYDFKPMITNIKEIVKNYDLAYYNQETILGGTDLGLSDYPTFNSPYEVGDAMIDAGFNLVSLATNHTMDRGAAAVENSCGYWNQHKDTTLAVGSYCSDEARNEEIIKEKNNITYTMLNYTYGTNGMPQIKNYYVNIWPTDLDINNPASDTAYQAYKEQVKADIEKVRKKVDVLIVAMHWGVEYTHTPTEYEKDMAAYLASLGVDIIIGTHPHVVQPVAWIDDTLVIYSLGNFISAQYQNRSTCLNYKCTVGLMTSLKIEKDIHNDDVKVKITDVDNELIYNYYNQASWRDFKVIPFSNPEITTHLPNYLAVYQTYKEVVQSMDANMKVKDAYQ